MTTINQRILVTITNTLKTGIDNATTRLGTRLEDAARKLRDSGPMLDRGAAADDETRVDHQRVNERAARGLSSLGSYLREAEFDQLAEDLTGLVKTHPGRAVALAAAAGFVVGATLGRATLLRFAVPTFVVPALTSLWDTLASPVAEPVH